SGLPAARRPAVLEHLGGVLRPQAPRPDPALPVELQLVAVLDQRRPTGGACVQHQHAHHVQQHVVVPYGGHHRPAGRDVLLLMFTRRPRRATGSVPGAVGRAERRRPQGDRAVLLGQLLAGRRRALAQPHPHARGRFQAGDVRQLSATPRAADFASRYVPDPVLADNPGGFNYKQFRSNVVFRWEYRPGSTLFVVWSQGRQNSTGAEGTQGFRGDLSDLFTLRPDNSFLVKLSYWINR